MTSVPASAPSIVAAARRLRHDPPLAAEALRDRIVAAVQRGLERLVGQRGERGDTLGLGAPDQPPDDVVGGTERDAAQDQRIGERGRRRVALLGGGLHPRPVDHQRLDQAGHHRQRRVERRDGREQRRLVLLEVALVGERQPLEQREHAGQRADDARCPSPDQLRGIGVLLVGHHR